MKLERRSFILKHPMRTAHQIYANDNEFHRLSLYDRHNRTQRGNLQFSNAAVDIQLLSMNGQFVSLPSYSHHNRSLLIIAGPYT